MFQFPRFRFEIIKIQALHRKLFVFKPIAGVKCIKIKNAHSMNQIPNISLKHVDFCDDKIKLPNKFTRYGL